MSWHRPVTALLPFLLALAQSFAAPRPVAAQSDDGWNSRRVLQMVEKARLKRHAMTVDSALRSYEARAEGHVYFLLDRTDTNQRTLVRADQLAVQLYWKAPGRVRQRIVGRRDQKKLPTNIRYHLDHLTVVTDDFGDRISIGQGEEVRSVVHPLALGSGSTYDFRLSDSLTIRYPGGAPVRVYEVQVRPRDPGSPGVVGNVYLDRATSSIVRMTFTFTPASYVDPTLDEIRISLHNSLWEGSFWLPYRQEIEIRRELPFLGMPAGSVIRGLWEIGDYRFNPKLPDGFFNGPPVTTLPPGALRSYAFKDGLFDEIQEDGLTPTPDLSRIRKEALTLLAKKRLSGLNRLRLFAPDASSVLRFDRAEGIHLGVGAAFDPSEKLGMDLDAGFSLGRRRPELQIRIDGGRSDPDTGIRIEWNRMRDIGPVTAASGAMNTLATAALDRDYLDSYFVTGAELFHNLDPDRFPRIELSVRAERQTAAHFVLDEAKASSYRPVLPVEEGTSGALSVRLSGGGEEGFAADARLTAGTFEHDGWGEITGRARWIRRWLASDTDLSFELRAGAVTSAAPLQSLYLLGGRATVPGFGYRAYVGDRYWLANVSASRGLWGPWVRPRIFAAAGGTGLAGRVLPATWESVRPTSGPLFSAGMGVGLLWNVLHVDLARGVNGGGWEWDLSVDRKFWPYL